MKVSSLGLLAGVSVPLIAVQPAHAGFVGITVSSARYPGPIIVFSVYAEFDDPGVDFMTAVAGTPGLPLTVGIANGTFFQHEFGTDKAPLDVLVQAFPDLAHDTFVTIGVRSVGPPDGQPQDNLTLTPGWPGFGPSQLFLTNAGWAITPNDPQGDPFNEDYVAGDGRLLIGQFSTTTGTELSGTVLIKTSPAQFYLDFNHHHCFEIDIDGDGMVGISDFLDVIGDWGCEGPDCVGDVSGDGVVGIRDFIDTLVFWGPCP